MSSSEENKNLDPLSFLIHLFGGKYSLVFSFVAQSVKNQPAMQETQVWFLGQEDPLEKEMANLSSIITCRIPWTEEPGRLQSVESQKSDMT